MILREVVRILMWQVREEQQLRLDALAQTTSHEPAIPPTDVEVHQRIEEVRDILKGKVSCK